MSIETKKCNKCNEIKEINLMLQYKGKINNVCRKCHNAITNKRRKEHLEENKKSVQKYQQKKKQEYESGEFKYVYIPKIAV